MPATPSRQISCAACRGTVRWNAFPNDIVKVSERHYAVDGTPSDCVRIALNMILADKKPDLIISGINNGRNIADDITYSGTIGVAVEGILHGIPSIAVSQLVDGAEVVNWQMAEKYLPGLLQKICRGTFGADTLININFPNVPFEQLKGITVCRHGSRRFTPGTIEEWPPESRFARGRSRCGALP